MKKRLTRIEPLQFGKVAAVGYGVMSLLIVPFFLFMAVVGLFIPETQDGPPPMAFVIGAVVGAIVAPVMYAAMGFVFGALGALIYNLIARWIGGIEVEVE